MKQRFFFKIIGTNDILEIFLVDILEYCILSFQLMIILVVLSKEYFRFQSCCQKLTLMIINC